MAYKYLTDMHTRLDRRLEVLKKRIEKLKRQCDQGRIGGEEDRQWIAKQVEHLNYGLDICSGDFLMADNDNVVGVDGDWNIIGAEYTFMQADELTRWQREECEFVVTNYLDAFPNILKALNEWNRVLKPGGLLVFTCADADTYEDGLGPFCNVHRQNAVTRKTVIAYLTKAQFGQIYTEPGEGHGMRVKAVKL